MSKILLTLFIFLFPGTSSAVEPLLATWDSYQEPAVQVVRLELWRGIGGGSLQRYAVFPDITTTTFMDGAVRKNKTYCYSLVAVNASGTPSPMSPSVCARPRR